eukprot:COSAG02_NODE_108_length_36286_cov_19.437478_5_plen_116_part_00
MVYISSKSTQLPGVFEYIFLSLPVQYLVLLSRIYRQIARKSPTAVRVSERCVAAVGDGGDGGDDGAPKELRAFAADMVCQFEATMGMDVTRSSTLRGEWRSQETMVAMMVISPAL